MHYLSAQMCNPQCCLKCQFTLHLNKPQFMQSEIIQNTRTAELTHENLGTIKYTCSPASRTSPDRHPRRRPAARPPSGTPSDLKKRWCHCVDSAKKGTKKTLLNSINIQHVLFRNCDRMLNNDVPYQGMQLLLR